MDLYNEIAKVAYEIFEREGCLHGRHLEHWCEAEVIITTKYQDVDKNLKNAETPKPKKRAAVKTTAAKSKTEPKAKAKTASKPKVKKAS